MRPINSRQPLFLALSLAAVLACTLHAALRAEEDVDFLEEEAMKQAVATAAGSVVRIETIGGLETVGKNLVGTGPTTGVVASTDGYIVSSAANFAQQPASILITLPNGKRKAAKIVSRDLQRKLVFLKVEVDEPLALPEVVSRDQLQVGQWAMAIGRTFSSDHPNVSVGIVSATNRIWGKAIQTDAKISPSNYGGPLVDIEGRVMGILVPLSPNGAGEMAGAEWYDSGIGFAVPLDEILARGDVWKSGKDLKPGLLGITLKGKDIYAPGVEVATVRSNSPAALAKIKAGDEVLEVNGKQIVRQAHLKHILGSKYAGDKIELKLKRDGDEVVCTATLADELVPYQEPFLGILPVRNRDGVAVRYVYDDSGAAKAGLQVGDEIVELNGKEVVNTSELRIALADNAPGDKVTLKVKREEQVLDLVAELSQLNPGYPGDLPPQTYDVEPPEEQPVTGVVERKEAEERGECVAYIPENYNPAVPHGVVLWLHGKEGVDNAKLEKNWKEICERYALIVLAPKASSKKSWSGTDLEFAKKVFHSLKADYTIDPTRVVIQGNHTFSGTFAFILCNMLRTEIRGCVVVDAVLPPKISLITFEVDPANRLEFMIPKHVKSVTGQLVDSAVKTLREAKFSVLLREYDGDNQPLKQNELQDVARWVDTLDRI